jgi:hypothetical protein
MNLIVEKYSALKLDEYGICSNLVTVYSSILWTKFRVAEMFFSKITKQSFKNSFLVVVAFMFAVGFAPLLCSRPVNRHLPFWSELCRDSKDDVISSNLFLTESSWEFLPKDRRPKVYKPFGGMDLSLKTLNDSYNQFLTQLGEPTKQYLDGSGLLGLEQYKRNDLIFESYVDTTVRGAELAFYRKWNGLFDASIEKVKMIEKLGQFLTGTQLFVGAQLPIVGGQRTSEYQPAYLIRAINNSRGSITGEAANERLRKKIAEFAEDGGLKIGYWSDIGFGDLDVYVGVGKQFDYCLRCSSIDLAAAVGFTFPTGKAADIDNPLAFSFGREGFGWHVDFMTKIELRRGLAIGSTIEWNSRVNSFSFRRLPLKSEAEGWSPLKAEFGLQTGSIIRFSPYIAFQNFMDWWLDLSVGFSYLSQGASRWTDSRVNPAVKSFVTSGDAIAIQNRLEASAWSARFFNVKVAFDTGNAGNNWTYKPVIWLTYDHPWERAVDVAHRRFAFGATLRF